MNRVKVLLINFKRKKKRNLGVFSLPLLLKAFYLQVGGGKVVPMF